MVRGQEAQTSNVVFAAKHSSVAVDAPPSLSAVHSIHYPIGNSPAACVVRQQIAQVARFTTTVLLLGASGTGKDLAAHQVHALSERFRGAFVAVNCGAIPSELLESELFGHERSALLGIRRTTLHEKIQKLYLN